MTVSPELRTSLDKILPWALRAAVIVLAFTVGPQVSRWLDDSSSGAQTTAAAIFWTAWGLSVLASLIPLPVTLTVLRVVSPAALVASTWAAIDNGDTGYAIAGLLSAGLLVALAFHAVIGDAFVDGSSYGDERRFLLRYPGQLLLGPIPLAWAALVSVVVAGPMLLATQRWVAGVMLCAFGLVVAYAAWRSLHALHRRWTVMVPAGFVLHDPMTLREPVLFGRTDVMALGPAPADFAGLDLTNVALGLALRVELRKPASLFLTAGESKAIETDQFAFSPTRPGAVVKEAKSRRLPIA
jgi:hypothetical protein